MNNQIKNVFQNTRNEVKSSVNRVTSFIKRIFANTMRIFGVSFLKSLGFFVAFLVIISVIMEIFSFGTVYFRDTAFRSKPLWEFSKKQDKISYVAKSYNWKKAKQPEIALIRANGIIMPDCYSHGVLCPQTFRDLFDYFDTKQDIKAVVLVLNSPGGEVYASEAIYQIIKQFNARVPVIVYVESETASGAYYISLGSSKIYASPVSTIGSIGVYLEVFDYSGLLDKLGVKHKYIVSSNAKYKVVTEWLFDNSKEADYVNQQIQDLIDSSENVFRTRVKQNRPNVDLSRLNGLIFSSDKALNLGLIDGIYETPQQVIEQILLQKEFKDADYQVVEYSLATLGSFNGITAYFNNVNKALLGGYDVRLMWK